MATTTTKPSLVSPWQASRVYGGIDGVPRQRQVFLVRFLPGAASAGDLSPLTYVVKHCDRPKVSPKIEELNQYNKKRVIYTGYKVDPVKITFYDSADGSAQDLWTKYARYYFGDFAVNAEYSYGDDITSRPFNNGFQGASAGLSEEYNGLAAKASQWFFDSIEIYQFYILGNTRLFDCYTLLHPRISSYDPDEMDYETSVVAQINMTFNYENLQYKAKQSVAGSAFDEFSNKAFNGRPLIIPNPGATSVGASGEAKDPANPAVAAIISTATGATPSAAPYRLLAETATGALGTFGQYDYGGAITAALGSIAPPSLASLGVDTSTLSGLGIDPAVAQQISTLAQWTGIDGIASNAGASLSAAAMGAINSAQTGTAQYGINLASEAVSSIDFSSFGF